MSPAAAKKTATKEQQVITILHLYPEELNIYGDRGNILTLVQRLSWRGYPVSVVKAGLGDKVKWNEIDLIFGGGGQDRGQHAVGRDIQRHADQLHKLSEAGLPMLTICGTYQLFGRDFTTLEGDIIPGISLFKARTIGSRLRMIGNVVIDSNFGKLVGFENHSGRTILEEGQRPLGEVMQGYGNDGKSGYEGAAINQTYGTYLHGPVLPKNPVLADALLLSAVRRHYEIEKLEPLNDYLEQTAAKDAMQRPQ